MYRRAKLMLRSKSGIDSVFVMTAFLLFVCCLLAAVLTFAKVYKSHGESINARFDKCTASSLVIQKLHAYDCGGVSVKRIDDRDVLCLSETIDGAEYVTYLYSDGQNLCELFAAADYPFDISDGNAVIPSDYFSAELSGGRLTFTIGTNGEKTCYTYTIRTAMTADFSDGGKAGNADGG